MFFLGGWVGGGGGGGGGVVTLDLDKLHFPLADMLFWEVILD